MIDVDGDGRKDLVASSPFGSYSTVLCFKRTATSVCNSGEIILAQSEKFFGWNIKSLDKTDEFYSPSLFVGTPSEARIDQFLRADGYSAEVYPKTGKMTLDPTVAKSASVSYCVKLVQWPLVHSPPFELKIDFYVEGSSIYLKNESLVFNLEDTNVEKCMKLQVYFSYQNNDLSTSTIRVQGNLKQ